MKFGCFSGIILRILIVNSYKLQNIFESRLLSYFCNIGGFVVFAVVEGDSCINLVLVIS